VLGAALLLVLPQRVFGFIVPALVAFARRFGSASAAHIRSPRVGERDPALAKQGRARRSFSDCDLRRVLGAAQGVILIRILTTLLPDPIQELNAVKNLLVGLTNLIAALIFIAVAHFNWEAATVVAVSSVVGGQLGSVVGQRLHPLALRLVIVAAGRRHSSSFSFEIAG